MRRSLALLLLTMWHFISSVAQADPTRAVEETQYAELIRSKGFNCPVVVKVEDYRHDHYGRAYRIACQAPAFHGKAYGYSHFWEFRVTRRDESSPDPAKIDVKPW